MAKQISEKDESLNALELLANDHQAVIKMFSQFEKIKDTADDEERRALVKRACEELTIHAQVEEELFYPAMRDALHAQEALDEAEVEHASITELVMDLEFMEPNDKLYDAKFKVLAEYVRHHIKEEEGEIFPMAKKSSLDLLELGQEIANRKRYLAEIFGVTMDPAISAQQVARKRSPGGGSSKKHH